MGVALSLWMFSPKYLRNSAGFGNRKSPTLSKWPLQSDELLKYRKCEGGSLLLEDLYEWPGTRESTYVRARTHARMHAFSIVFGEGQKIG